METIAWQGNLRSGNTTSCGCFLRELTAAQSTTHGCAARTGSTRTYHSWGGMLERCRNPRNQAYARYGGRGISVCDRWQQFENFLTDMGECPTDRSLDRIDNNGNYEPGNCRWATRQEQNANTRTARLITHNGVTDTLAGWARRLGKSPATLAERLERGWPLERALSPEDNRLLVMFTHAGITDTLSGWARRLGKNSSTLHNRLIRGWPVEEILSPERWPASRKRFVTDPKPERR